VVSWGSARPGSVIVTTDGGAGAVIISTALLMMELTMAEMMAGTGMGGL
jgi:hypothetical protein